MTQVKQTSEQANRSFRQEARLRRIEALIDALLDFRDHINRSSPDLKGRGERLHRLRLARQLEVRLTLLTRERDNFRLSILVVLRRGIDTTGDDVEDALSEARQQLLDEYEIPFTGSDHWHTGATATVST